MMMAGILAQSARGIPWDAGSVQGMGAFQVAQGIHYNMTDPSTLFDDASGGGLPAPNAAVKRVEDKSGNSRHATQSNDANSPIRITTGIPAIQFDGSNDFLSRDMTFLVGVRYTILAFVTRNSNKNNNIFIGGTAQLNSKNLHAGYRSDTVFTLDHFFSGIDVTVPTYTEDTSDLFVVGINSVGKFVRREGTLIGSDTDTSLLTEFNGSALGRYLTSNIFFLGRIHLLILIPSELVESLIQRFEGFAAHLLGTASKLPVSHPFKPIFPGRYLP